jgi:hypothetical protein
MAAAATTRRFLGSARLLLVLAAIVGVVGMHALVVGAPAAAHTVHLAHSTVGPFTGPGTGLAASPLAASPLAAAAEPARTDADGAHGGGHDPADHTGLAHLCLALAAVFFLLAVRRTVVPAAPAAAPTVRTLVRTAVERWVRPPPDPVGVLCVSRT